MKNNFVVECYFDTVLIKAILRTKKVNHQFGCYNVVNKVKNELCDDFAVGIIDMDKREIDYLKYEFLEEIKLNNLVLLKHKTKQHYFIQLAPAIEVWILKVVNEGGLNIENYGLSSDLNKLKKITKSKFAEKDENLRNLCRKLIESNCKTISILVIWLTYLFEHNRNADINKLKENV